MKYIITETQEKKIYLLRRLPEFEKYLKKIMKDDHPCDYESADDYANILIESAILETFDLTWDDYNSLLDDFEFKKVIIDKYHDELVKKYNKEKCDE